jgi:hypothetical protein
MFFVSYGLLGQYNPYNLYPNIIDWRWKVSFKELFRTVLFCVLCTLVHISCCSLTRVFTYLLVYMLIVAWLQSPWVLANTSCYVIIEHDIATESIQTHWNWFPHCLLYPNQYRPRNIQGALYYVIIEHDIATEAIQTPLKLIPTLSPLFQAI